MKKALLVLAVVGLYALHQDVWLWRTARPLVFGFVPAGLFYHACFSLASAALMAALVRWAWPARLEAEVEEATGGGRATSDESERRGERP
jgi:hypothetical protein